MRIERLDLTRYGRFSDYRSTSAPSKGRGPDFHVVYGLNEAGKSTVAAAILDLLFGIEKRSHYGAAKGRASVPNWHAYNAMRIGARLDLDGAAVEVARLKRDKSSLVDQTIGRSTRPAEGGPRRRRSRALPDDVLARRREPGEGRRGDPSKPWRSRAVPVFRERGPGRDERPARGPARSGRGFYKPRGKITELAEKKRALDVLKDERDRLDTAASAYADLVRRRDEAKATHDLAMRALGERRTRAEAIRRTLAALPHLAALAEAERRLAPLADLPTPAAGWPEEVARLQAEAIRLTTQRESAETGDSGSGGGPRAPRRRSGRACARRPGRGLARKAQPLRYGRGHPCPPERARRPARRRRRYSAPARPGGRGGARDPAPARTNGRRAGGADRVAVGGGVEARRGARYAGLGAERARRSGRVGAAVGGGQRRARASEEPPRGGATRRLGLPDAGGAGGGGKGQTEARRPARGAEMDGRSRGVAISRGPRRGRNCGAARSRSAGAGAAADLRRRSRAEDGRGWPAGGGGRRGGSRSRSRRRRRGRGVARRPRRRMGGAPKRAHAFNRRCV